MIKAVGYIRVSTEEQAKEGYSLENQEKEIKNFCKNKGWELINIFADEGISGASLNEREGIINALKFIQNKNIDYLIVWKLSRLSRKVSDVVNIVEILEQNNSYFVSIKDNIDTSTPMGKTFLYIAGIFAELERENIIVQIKGGMSEKAREGYWNGGTPPLGYNLIDGQLKLNDQEAEIVKYIFSEYLKGYGYKTIAKNLNQLGYKTKKGNEFSGNAIKDILKNPIYCGKIRWGYRENWNKKNSNNKKKRQYSDNPIISEGAHDSIIDEQLFNKVQLMINTNPRHNVKQFNAHHTLSGLLRCPDCGYGMSIQVIKSKGKKYEYYSCNQYINYKKCRPNTIPKDLIEDEFFTILEKIINEKEFKEILLNSLNNNKNIEELENQIKKYEDKINKLNKNIRSLTDELAEEENENYKKTIRNRIKELLHEISNLENNINHNLNLINEIKNNNINADEFIVLLENFSKIIKLSDKETQKNLIRKLISNIQVKDQKISEITFVFNKSFRIEDGTVHR